MNRLLIIVMVAFMGLTTMAQRRQMITDYSSKDAIRVGDQMLQYQRVTGGWPKNIDMFRPMGEREMQAVLKDKQRTDDSTVDNNATTTQMTFLANVYQKTGEQRFKEGFLKGMEYLLSGQYENGGWPQFWPNPHGYQVHITFNDNNIVNMLTMFQAIVNGEAPYQGDLISDEMRERIKVSFDKGIDIILKTQMRVNGKLTVWCQQHDKDTYEPAPARAFELVSYCTMETVALTRLLMSLPNPDKRVKAAVNASMQWLDKYKISGYRVERTGPAGNRTLRETRLVEDANAKPIWGRFYDMEFCEPYVCDRDGIARRSLTEIGYERRSGYSWYGNYAEGLYDIYNEWAAKYDKKQAGKLAYDTKGGNEKGVFQMFRKPVHNLKDYDVVVNPGESIQKAIEKAPARAQVPFRIYVRNGLYEQKVIIDKPNIMLIGEDKEKTIIRIAETEKTNTVREYNGKKIHHGVVVLTEEADSCLISGFTIYNNYGTAVEPGNTTHQMAIFGAANHTIIINCNVWADGNDALSLWAKNGNGMYYHADLFLRCPGVDFLCPRGWCYATRCRFYGDSRAMLWHDGRGDKTKKLVVTNSHFDAASPTKLGRWHHDSQFYIVNCRMTDKVLDSNIQYAYSDKVLDPCPWGERVYYLQCEREGGHSGWLDDNMDKSETPGNYYTYTSTWTFGKRWDPENHIRNNWKWVAY